jgi:energy-converting hydrogenase Eha subunit C
MTGSLTRATAMEWVKICTTATWWALLLLALGVIALNVVLTAAVVPVGEATEGEAAAFGTLNGGTADGQRAIVGSGFQSAYLLSAVLGAILGAVDFRHRTATWTFLMVPGRGAVAVAKLLVAALAGLGYGVVGQAASLGLAAGTLSTRGVDVQVDANLWRSLGLGVLAVAAWAVVGASVGLLLRNQIAAILGVIGWIFLVDPIGSLVAAGVGEVGGVDLADVVAYSPGNASSAIVESVTGVDLLPWWAGVLVLLGWSAVATGAALLVSLRRDLT